MRSDLEIAREATLRPITEVAAVLGLEPDDLDLVAAGRQDGFADGHFADFGRHFHHVGAGALIGGGGRDGDAPERLQPSLAINDGELVVLGLGEQAGHAGQGAERLQPLGPGAALGMLQAEAIGHPEDALFGEFDLHVGLPSSCRGIHRRLRGRGKR